MNARLAVDARHAARYHFAAALDFRAMRAAAVGEIDRDGYRVAAEQHWRHAKRETLVALVAEGEVARG